ncbi:phosphatidylserine/phosphatidylglycerophosphate/cardiolipin synthase family protein [Proteobacteria bacterium 005FR1]|nr:phosphatidylserine/phosphatidylglycerophosphate/cardiolipin synthase family protein [Proteobacteria bacterium 005FR1]
MKLIANRINGVHLRDILPDIAGGQEVDSVMAAIAYGENGADETKDLLGHCVGSRLRLDLWMRYDEKVPVAIPLLKRLLKHQRHNVFTNFIPDCFHSKVIWWKGYGAYIGSANHTDRGWLTNIEAGVFLSTDDLLASGMDTQLEEFFEYLGDLAEAIPISPDYVEEMEELARLNNNIFDRAGKARRHPRWHGPTFVVKNTALEKRKRRFREEWLNTLGTLKYIESQMPDYRPRWIDSSIPTGWQVDQFLHAYYYTRVGEGLLKPYEELHVLHRADPNSEMFSQLEWWKNELKAPYREDVMLYESAPVLQRLLDKNKVLTLSVDEFEEVCRRTHATGDHVIKIPASVLGRSDVSNLNREERFGPFAELVMSQVNKKGWDVRKLLHYVLYEGAESELWERLYHAGRDDEYKIARYGLNSLAEVVGWVRPDVAPPRNGRTSKALRALGFDAKVY